MVIFKTQSDKINVFRFSRSKIPIRNGFLMFFVEIVGSGKHPAESPANHVYELPSKSHPPRHANEILHVPSPSWLDPAQENNGNRLGTTPGPHLIGGTMVRSKQSKES